jgi:hypothetical protein
MTAPSLWMQRTARAHLLTMQAAVCAGKQLVATAQGYTKSTGAHFVEEGFAAGMEVTVSDFATPSNNGIKYVTSVTQSLLSVEGGAVPELQNGPRTIRAFLPSRRAWENVAFTPVHPYPYVADRWLGGPSTVRTIPALGGWMETTPQYQILFYAATDTGMDALASYADGTLRHFRPGLALPDPVTGNVLRVRGDTGPFRGSLLYDTPGWSVLSVTIPLRVESRNI